jgi:hypothetical protein
MMETNGPASRARAAPSHSASAIPCPRPDTGFRRGVQRCSSDRRSRIARSVEGLAKSSIRLLLRVATHNPNRRRFESDPVGHRADKYREVLGLYRKREGARRLHEHGALARIRHKAVNRRVASSNLARGAKILLYQAITEFG